MLGAEQVSTLAAPLALSRLPFMTQLTNQPFTRLPSSPGFELDSDACLFHSDSEPSGSVGYPADDTVSYAASSSSSVAGDDNSSVTAGFFQESLPRSMLPQLVASPRKTASASAIAALRPTALEAFQSAPYPRQSPRQSTPRHQQQPYYVAGAMTQQPSQARAYDAYGSYGAAEPAYSVELPQQQQQQQQQYAAAYADYSQHQLHQQATPTHLRAEHAAMKRKLVGFDGPYQQQQQQAQPAMSYYHHAAMDPNSEAFAAPLKRARVQQEEEIKLMPLSCNTSDMYGMPMPPTAPLTPASHYLPSMTTSRVSFHATVGEVSPQGMMPVHVQQRIVHHTRTSVPSNLITPTSMDHMSMLTAGDPMNPIKAEPSPFAQQQQQQRSAFDFEPQPHHHQQQSPLSGDWNSSRWYAPSPASNQMPQAQSRVSMGRSMMDSVVGGPSAGTAGLTMPGAVPHLAVAELPYCNRTVAAAIALPALELSHLSMPGNMSAAAQSMLPSSSAATAAIAMPSQQAPSSVSSVDGSPVPPKKVSKAKRTVRKAKAAAAAPETPVKAAKVKVQPHSPHSAASAADDDESEGSPKAASPDSTPGLILVCSVESCRKEFSSRYSHRRHMRNHTGERPHVCPFDNCDAKFAERSTLVRHIRVHTGEKPYKCSFPGCNQAFADRTNVKRHLLTHTGTKPYPCMYADCSRRYSRKCYLTKHMISSHNYVPPAPSADAEEEDFDSQAFEEEERDQSPASRRK